MNLVNLDSSAVLRLLGIGRFFGEFGEFGQYCCTTTTWYWAVFCEIGEFGEFGQY